MQNRWNIEEASTYQHSLLALRVYSSRLLGAEPALVLHGGGNTSVKTEVVNILGDLEEVLYVKGSGWDLRTIEAAGYAPTRLAYLRRLVTLESLSDREMMRQLRLALLDPAAPTPSVEAILHAIIPLRFVDHTHSDALVAISNTADGESTLKTLLGEQVLVLPYIMPGFVLARQVYLATRDRDWSALKGIFLMHHGLFTFADEARDSYEQMLALVNRAEQFLQARACHEHLALGSYQPAGGDYLELAGIRREISTLAGRPMLAAWHRDAEAVGFAALPQVADIARRGPLTPDHSIHTKIIPALIETDARADLAAYAAHYRDYFDRFNKKGELSCLDPAPRFAVWRNKGMLSFGQNRQRCQVVADISAHTIRAIQWGEVLGGWQPLPEADLFAVEYWELEQAKLGKAAAGGEFDGRVVLVSGAASGIGAACVTAFLAQGACVLALDIQPGIETRFDSERVLGLCCDVTSATAIQAAIEQGIARFGGLDVVISNAGSFPPSCRLADMSDELWESSQALNLNAHMKLLRAALPFLALGIEPSVIFVASKNVPAPGPGAGAYAAAKAGLTQLARVAALELGEQGIRVNVLHPNAVFDTAIWTPQTLAQRAAHYGMTVMQYKTSNVLKVEVFASDVAHAARSLAGAAFAKTTGAQIAVDGGNDRVI
ncbi:MAG: bifunctional aldolase/short-chain dehydrogenase [Pseudomonadales bacterium]|nr:bifunctional aldolase/short-chain dehydrogenase [Pseudomonadales bacterium]